MKRIYLIFAIISGQLAGFAQNTGSVEGTIRTSDGNPAEYVNVSIEGTSKGTVADRNGFFEIRNLATTAFREEKWKARVSKSILPQTLLTV
jgi:iron complex outermembrane receptor protein